MEMGQGQLGFFIVAVLLAVWLVSEWLLCGTLKKMPEIIKNSKTCEALEKLVFDRTSDGSLLSLKALESFGKKHKEIISAARNKFYELLIEIPQGDYRVALFSKYYAFVQEYPNLKKEDEDYSLMRRICRAEWRLNAYSHYNDLYLWGEQIANNYFEESISHITTIYALNKIILESKCGVFDAEKRLNMIGNDQNFYEIYCIKKDVSLLKGIKNRDLQFAAFESLPTAWAARVFCKEIFMPTEEKYWPMAEKKILSLLSFPKFKDDDAYLLTNVIFNSFGKISSEAFNQLLGNILENIKIDQTLEADDYFVVKGLIKYVTNSIKTVPKAGIERLISELPSTIKYEDITHEIYNASTNEWGDDMRSRQTTRIRTEKLDDFIQFLKRCLTDGVADARMKLSITGSRRERS
jgi:hypothetical protein